MFSVLDVCVPYSPIYSSIYKTAAVYPIVLLCSCSPIGRTLRAVSERRLSPQSGSTSPPREKLVDELGATSPPSPVDRVPDDDDDDDDDVVLPELELVVVVPELVVSDRVLVDPDVVVVADCEALLVPDSDVACVELNVDDCEISAPVAPCPRVFFPRATVYSLLRRLVTMAGSRDSSSDEAKLRLLLLPLFFFPALLLLLLLLLVFTLPRPLLRLIR